MTTDIELFNEAMSGERGDEQKRIASTGMTWLAALIRKNSADESAIWNAPPLVPNMTASSAILFRMSDTVSRLMNLSKDSADVTPESFDRTIQDLAEYCLLYLASPERTEESSRETPEPTNATPGNTSPESPEAAPTSGDSADFQEQEQEQPQPV